MGSTKQRKSRKKLYTAKLHEKKAYLNARISKELAEKLNTKKRSIPLKKGDSVMLMVGQKKSHKGKILKVELKDSRVYMEGVSKKNAKGIEKPVPIHPSNLTITDGDFTGWRKKILARSKK